METNKNRFNTGTKYGRGLIEHSLQELGCGRSVLADKNGVIIAGNDVYDTAIRLGFKVITIETEGDVLVVVKRTDLDANSKKGKELAFVDNLAQEKNLEWDWYTDSNTFRVFMHLLLTANYKDCTYKGVVVKRGQVATSRMEIAKALRMSEQNVRTSLSHLKSTSEITTESTNKLTIITVCKYDSWQKVTSETNQQTNQQTTDILTSNQPSIEEESNKLNNNIKKEDTNVSPKKNDYQAIIDCWNEHNGKSIAKVTSLTDKRKKAIKKQLDDHKITQDVLMRFFASLPYADRWLYNPTGEHKTWKPNFDWWMANTNSWLTKGLEGGVHVENPRAFERIMGGADSEYTPQGRTIWFNEETKSYWSDDNFYYGTISDGYDDESRPDGATLTLNNARGDIRWNGITKQWEKK